MRVITSIAILQQTLQSHRKKGKTIGFVPTMGYFHEGHLSLMQKAKQENDLCVVSIYVNPAQFGPKEDLSKYPRDIGRDSSLAKKEKVDILFFPSDNDMYPKGYCSTVNVAGISQVLCGAFRPGHFTGVATVVAKLLNITGPCQMYLGAKDAQQCVVLKTMVRDLNFPVKVIIVPTVRESDGLAMSSRNLFLSTQERQQALILNKALQKASNLINAGELKASIVLQALRKMFLIYPKVKVQYIACVNAQDLKPLTTLSGDVMIAIAAFVGKTRLIDNCIVSVHGKKK